jgi:hypothetical protein
MYGNLGEEAEFGSSWVWPVDCTSNALEKSMPIDLGKLGGV